MNAENSNLKRPFSYLLDRPKDGIGILDLRFAENQGRSQSLKKSAEELFSIASFEGRRGGLQAQYWGANTGSQEEGRNSSNDLNVVVQDAKKNPSQRRKEKTGIRK